MMSLHARIAYVKGKEAESEKRSGTCEQQQPGALRIKLRTSTTGDF